MEAEVKTRKLCRWCSHCSREEGEEERYKCSVTGHSMARASVGSRRSNFPKSCEYVYSGIDCITGLSYSEWYETLDTRKMRSDSPNTQKCMLCGKLMPYSYKEVYCDECREEGRRQDKEKCRFYLDDQGLMHVLIEAVYTQVCKDYRSCLRRLMKVYDKTDADVEEEPPYSLWKQKDDLEFYMLGRPFMMFSDGRDPVKLIERLQKEVGFDEDVYERSDD